MVAAITNTLRFVYILRYPGGSNYYAINSSTSLIYRSEGRFFILLKELWNKLKIK
jgi:hypothetical protein